MTDSKSSKIIKTTIAIDRELWKKFSIKVIQEFGGRKNSDVMGELVKRYVNGNKLHDTK
jgi:hypothetical protein